MFSARSNVSHRTDIYSYAEGIVDYEKLIVKHNSVYQKIVRFEAGNINSETQ